MRNLAPLAFALCRRTIGKPLILALSLFPSLIHANTGDVWSDRIESNITVDGDSWGIGGRAYLHHDTKQLITRYRLNERYAAQFRWVTQNHGEAVEYRFRLQRNDFARGPFFWNTRVELRLKESNADTIRLRPQTGLKFAVSDKLQAYYKLEPHWDFKLSESVTSFKFVRHLIGFNYRPNRDAAYGPFLKFETDAQWSSNIAYLGFQFSIQIRSD